MLKRIYKNPEAKKWLVGFGMIAILSLLCLMGIAYLIYRDFDQRLTQQALSLLAADKINQPLLDYLQTGILTEAAQAELARLTALDLVPKIWSNNLSHYFFLAFLAWLLLSLVSFTIMTFSLKLIYDKVEKISTLSENLLELPDYYDIHTYNEGSLAKLQDNLYQTAILLHNQYKQANQHKEYLAKNIGDISHQLKTPLTSLYVVTDTLLSLPLEGRTNEKLASLEPPLERIEQLVQSLLLLTRMDAGVVTYKKALHKTDSLISELLTPLKSLLEHKAIDLKVSIPENSVTYADSFYLKEALSNLLKNAIDHTEPKGKIALTVTDTIFYTSFGIFNEGAPISQEDLPYVFQRFYRGKNALPTSVGIGLSLAFDIVAGHQGKLLVENQKNGVLFTATIAKN